jgi:hypothetical protein
MRDNDEDNNAVTLMMGNDAATPMTDDDADDK